jgi:hypothetical protein
MRMLPVAPASVLSLLALFFALGGSAFALSGTVLSPTAVKPQPRCANGAVRGLAVVTGLPNQGVENIPNQYLSDRQAFGRRFNCTGGGIQVRKVQNGTYEVLLAGLGGLNCVATSMVTEAMSTSCIPMGDGSYRVTLRGLDTSGNVLVSKDRPFMLVVF